MLVGEFLEDLDGEEGACEDWDYWDHSGSFVKVLNFFDCSFLNTLLKAKAVPKRRNGVFRRF